jgi:hypothetical protein
MRNLVAAALLLLLMLVSSTAFSLDQGYVKTFGWGKVLISDKGYPSFDRMDASQFNFSGGQFQITGGKDREMAARILLKDGKTYDYYVDKVKKANGKKAKGMKKTFIRTYIYVSNDIDGKQFFSSWPAKMDQKPKGEYTIIENNFEKGWVSSGVTTQDFKVEASKFMGWLEKARPGWSAYFVHVAGFVREAPELKYWDKSKLKWMIPVEYVESEPIAVGQVNIAASTNPTLAWSHKVVSMPTSQKGEDKGQMTVLKAGAPYTTYGFNTKLDYQNQVTKQYNYSIAIYNKRDSLIGTFPVQCPEINACITNAFYECVQRQLAMDTMGQE